MKRVNIFILLALFAMPCFASQKVELKTQCWKYESGPFGNYTNLQLCQSLAQFLNSSSTSTAFVEAECLPAKNTMCNGFMTKSVAILKTQITVP